MKAARKFRVRVDDREHDVELGEDGRVKVGALELETVLGPGGRVSVHVVGSNERVLVTVAPGADPRHAAAEGRAHAIQVMTAQQAALADIGRASRRADEGRTLRSPMPGRIVRVLVGEGEEVAADTAVVIVEAMKMENEVRTTSAGRISRVAVKGGDTVDAGAVLCELEPHAAGSSA
ncbi:MAG TPA: biotin/lipoyl-containing protein [Nannocystaceae bacterium]|nr:biotin/lipoyl-containing protein [Nannocystaceae bacterium]